MFLTYINLTSKKVHEPFSVVVLAVPVLTGMVPAASSGRSSPPGAVELADAPVFDRVVFDGVGGQSADFNTRVVTQELVEGHPAEIGQGRALTPQLQTPTSLLCDL